MLRITISGEGAAQAELEAIADRLRDLRPVMRIAAQDTVTLTDTAFEDQRSPSGDDWDDHSPWTMAIRLSSAQNRAERRTVARAAKRGRTASSRAIAGARERALAKAVEKYSDARKLIDTGRLRQSITGRSGRAGFSFGSNVVYAGAQQFGNPENRLFGKQRAPIPARPFMPVELDGSRFALMTTGSAGQHWTRIRAMVSKYIRTGDLTG